LGRIALECDSQTEFQQTILRRLERTLGAQSSLYFAISKEQSRWSFNCGISRGVPDQGPKLWNQRYYKQDPFVNAFLEAPNEDSPVVVSSQIMSHKKLIATEFYADFLKPQSVYHVLVLGLVSHHKPIGLFGFHRPLGAAHFSRRETEKACLLAPFLSAAVEKATRTEESGCYQSVIDQIAHDSSNQGVIVLNKQHIPLYANSTAEKLLHPAMETPCQEPLEGGCMSQHLLNFCRQIGDRKTGKLNRPDKADLHPSTNLSVEVHRCNDGTQVIYLNNGESSNIRQDRLKEFCLTTRQRAIVHLVSTGMTNPEIADKLFISIRTVQNHLRAIYNKVDVHNRTSLVNRLSH